jgi:hypothetical protein
LDALDALPGTPELSQRCAVLRGPLAADGADPSDIYRAKKHAALRDAWRTWVNAADASGLIDDNLRGRLRGGDPDNFHGGMAECLAAWFFVERLSCKIRPRVPGRSGSVLEFSAERDGIECDVEVKCSMSKPFVFDSYDVLEKDLRDANKQLCEGRRNIVVLVPYLNTSIYDHPEQLVRAMVGQLVLQVFVEKATGAPAGTAHGVKMSGIMTRGGGGENPDGTQKPMFTRIGAVLALEAQWVESMRPAGGFDVEAIARYLVARHKDENAITPEVRPLVVHNPNAAEASKVPEEFLGGNRIRQFVMRGETQRWNDAPEDVPVVEAIPPKGKKKDE